MTTARTLQYVALVEDRGPKAAPRIRVRCPKCRDVYVTSQWPSNLHRARTCARCARTRTRKRARPMNTATQLPTASRHSSESSDHYTPPAIVDAARTVLRAIDLDPASCAEANSWICADRVFTRDDDGFKRMWFGRVFLNPPGGLSDDQQRPVKKKCRENGSCGLPVPHEHTGVESSQKKWWFKLAAEYASHRVPEAIFVCFSVELLQTTQCEPPEGLLLPLDFPICFPSRRIAYVKPGGEVGTAPPHASAIVYLGTQRLAFARAFAPLGRTIGHHLIPA